MTSKDFLDLASNCLNNLTFLSFFVIQLTLRYLSFPKHNLYFPPWYLMLAQICQRNLHFFPQPCEILLNFLTQIKIYPI